MVTRIYEQADELRHVSNDDLRKHTDAIREYRKQKPTSGPALIPCFAGTIEAIRRTVGITLYDVQVLAGLVLARGAIAEMQTGEGKTLATALPVIWHALAGRGAHVATPNSYLAERDFALLKPAYELLGLRPGLLRSQDAPSAKRAAYAADLTYGTGYDFGFDYLRDQLAAIERLRPSLGEDHRSRLRGESNQPLQLQRGHAAAVIDEIDSVLIDEACTPLVLSNAAPRGNPGAAVYHEARQTAEKLVLDRDFTVDERRRLVRLTHGGVQAIHAQLSSAPPLRLERPWSVYVEQALVAQWLRRRDVDYVVQDGQIRLVDEYTGRIFADRSWRDGLQQAVEAREGLAITAEMSAAASISRQRYFRRYDSVVGLTGTAEGAQREFWNMYRLPVVVIPPRMPAQRTALPTRYFSTHGAKWDAVVESIATMHRHGRPILVGSRTIENSELLAARLASAGVSFRLLNGKQDEDEARVVARAGEAGAVTIATNMAGRGTDIKLAPGVAQLGGLHMIGVERHESERIDRQLVGRVARQGDPGSFQFFVSADDTLITRHDPDLAERMRTLAGPGGELVADLSLEIAALQRRVEREQYRQRSALLAHDGWLDEVRGRLVKGG